MRKILVTTLLLFLAGLTAPAQELFISTQSGSPFGSSSFGTDQLFWNYSFGYEHYMADKISVAFSYRKMFNLLGGIADVSSTSYNNNYGFNYTYSEDVSSYAFDIESKYFMDEPDDGWYVSSGLSYQHIAININVTDL